MRIEILTFDPLSDKEINVQSTEMFRSGAFKYINDHLVWAMNAGYGVQISPVDNSTDQVEKVDINANQS